MQGSKKKMTDDINDKGEATIPRTRLPLTNTGKQKKQGKEASKTNARNPQII